MHGAYFSGMNGRPTSSQIMDDRARRVDVAGAAGAGAMLVGVTWLIVRQRRLTRLAQELADAEAAARPMSNLEPEDGSGRSGGSAASPARARAPLRLDIEADGGASLLRAAAADEVPAAPLSSKRLRPPPASTTPRMSAAGRAEPEPRGINQWNLQRVSTSPRALHR